MTVYEADGVKVVFHFEAPQLNAIVGGGGRVINIRLVASTTATMSVVESFEFQAAVPKFCQLQLLPPSSTKLLPNGQPITQLLKLSLPSKVGGSGVFLAVLPPYTPH